MRDWRRIYGEKVVNSDRLAELSFEERWLWLLYTLAQDDEGRYPYTRVKLLALTVGTGWSWADCQRLTTGMSAVDLVTTDGSFVHITNGIEFNGRLRSDREVFLYTEPLPSAVYHRDTTDIPPGNLEERREEERREESPPAGAPRARGITPKFIERMVQEYGERLGGEAEVRQRIETAMNHTASKKWIDKQRGVQDWLRKDVEGRANGTATRNPRQARPSTDGWERLPFPDR